MSTEDMDFGCMARLLSLLGTEHYDVYMESQDANLDWRAFVKNECETAFQDVVTILENDIYRDHGEPPPYKRGDGRHMGSPCEFSEEEEEESESSSDDSDTEDETWSIEVSYSPCQPEKRSVSKEKEDDDDDDEGAAGVSLSKRLCCDIQVTS